MKARIDVYVEKECRYQSSKPFLRVAHVRMEPGGVWSYRQNKNVIKHLYKHLVNLVERI